MRGEAHRGRGGRGLAGGLALALVAGCGSATGRARAPDVNRMCSAGLYVVDGACLSPRQIDSFCGSRSLASTCVWPACAPGEALDPHAAACVSRRDTRAIVANARPTPSDPSTPAAREASLATCREGRVLVAHDEHAMCLPKRNACARGARPDPEPACRTLPPCPLGELRSGGACLRVARDHVVDVGAWTRAALGTDGGPGDERVCGTLAVAPWDADVGPGGSRTVALTIDLAFPDNDPSAATARVTADLSSAGVLALQTAVDSLLIPLRALAGPGGATDAASASVHLLCDVVGGSSPLLTTVSDR